MADNIVYRWYGIYTDAFLASGAASRSDNVQSYSQLGEAEWMYLKIEVPEISEGGIDNALFSKSKAHGLNGSTDEKGQDAFNV